MLVRALIVLLVVLNLGAAAWWMAGPREVAPVVVAQPAGIPRLELLDEGQGADAGGAVNPQRAGSDPEPIANPAADPALLQPETLPALPADAMAQAVAATCFALGPFDDSDAARTAATALPPGDVAAAPREIPGTAASGYTVFLPATGDREAALATASRVGAAGFDDYLVVNTGAMANSVALGRYATRQRAEARRSALQDAGFPAQIQPVGNEGAAQWWLDVRSDGASTAEQARSHSGAAQVRSVDCTTLR